MTLGEALALGARALEENSVASSRLTAEVLLAHATGTDRPFLHAHSDDPLNEHISVRYRHMIARRTSGEPLQYITGIQEFYGRVFHVDRSVLIPRPETEFLVESLLDINRWQKPRIVDVGTGSGCIAAVVSLERPEALVRASDISLAAVETAKRNANRLGATVLFACMEFLTAWSEQFEIIASNPPYVSREDRDGLQREVRDFEPELALFGDGNPLDFYERLLAEAENHLVDGGFLVAEIGYSMEAAVRNLFGKRWDLLPTRTDLQGIPRVVIARKQCVA